MVTRTPQSTPAELQAAADAAAQIRQLEKTLARIQQESQSTYQQFLMIQELRRNEIDAPLPITIPPSPASKSIPIPGYEELIQEKQEKADRIKKYAEDAGKSKEEIEKITQPKEELKFMASGVLLLDEKKGK